MNEDDETNDDELQSTKKKTNKRKKQIYESSSEEDDEYASEDDLKRIPEEQEDPTKDIFHLFKTVTGMNEVQRVEEKPRKKTKQKRECVAYGQLLNTVT